MVLGAIFARAPSQQLRLSHFVRILSYTNMASTSDPQTSHKSLEVVHNSKEHEFCIDLDPPDKAVLQYDVLTDGSVDMHHTGVPTSYRGKGIAGQLAKAALGHFTSHETKMILTCTYLQKYYREHPETRTDLVSLPTSR
ncbi:protein NATD1-like [Diadema antillarum]|uniref:protein NATD1-like n=2 Tax=Diadema antillarum TaxID=105358 RepID=UPI003A8B2FF5